MDTLLIFGGAALQVSLIEEANKMGLRTVVIDPDPQAEGRSLAGAFEVVAGNDFEGTCAVVEKHGVKGITTTATDKPLVMMARIAEKYGFPFFSVNTAVASTDKFLMKEVFQKNNIPCASGMTVNHAQEIRSFPVIIKPRDNSGSRGVIYCAGPAEAEAALDTAKKYSRQATVLAEEVIPGKEYSVESLHYGGKHRLIQITEKLTTPFPYTVEMGHIQPADLTPESVEEIRRVLNALADALGFDHCAAHTELKINERGIFVIETSPRLGGDYITSVLVPLSTGINMEKALIELALGKQPATEAAQQKASAVFYFNLGPGILKRVHSPESLLDIPGIHSFRFLLSAGSRIPVITNSLERYGSVIVSGKDRDEIEFLRTEIDEWARRSLEIIKTDPC